ncbi:MAG TPA: DUF502 domain-containing protein [Steroidobacteraceae bacterium]
MKPILDFIKTTLVGGVLFLIPLVIVIVILAKAHDVARKIVEPLVQALPIQEIAGMGAAKLLAALILLLIAFIAGLLARTSPAKRLTSQVESLILRRVPGYTLLKNMTDESVAPQTGGKIKVALANIDDAWMLAFIMEEGADGQLIVFVPSAPTPTQGSLYFLRENQVRRLDIPVRDAVKCIMQLGIGSSQLLRARGQVLQSGTSVE